MSQRTSRRLAKVTTGVALAGLLAACGGGNGVADLKASEILDKARKAASAAASVHVTGSMKDGGTSLKVDITFTESGSKGTITRNGKQIEFVATKKSLFMKGLGQLGGGIPNAAKGKYVKLSSDSSMSSSFKSFTSIKSFFDKLLDPDGKLKKVDGVTVNGTDTVGLKADESILYIATSGKPYPLQLVPSKKSKSKAGKVTFTDYGADVSIQPPPESKVIPMKQLMQMSMN